MKIHRGGQGQIASGATDSGNPVKIGGKYNATLPTLTDGQRGDVQLDSIANLRSLATAIPTTLTDSISNTSPVFLGHTTTQAGKGQLATSPLLFDGSTWNRQRNNAAATGLASAARTASTQSADQTNYNGRGAQIMLDVTGTPNNTETLQLTVEVKDSVSGKYFQIAPFTALTASVLGASPTTETYVYTVYPDSTETIAVAKHEVQSLPLGRTWRVNVLHSAAGSWTYSVGITNLL